MQFLPLIVWSLVSVSLTTTAPSPSFIENDSIVFPGNVTTQSSAGMSAKMKECIEDNKIEFNGECHSLLTTEGVCPDNSWLVLDIASASRQDTRIQGKCAPRRCTSGLDYWVRENRCVSANESARLCLRGNTVKTDVFGDGYCECIKEPAHAKGQTGECFPVYHKGPCAWDRVWTWVGKWAECRMDNCLQARQKSPTKTVVPFKNGQCYLLNDKGPCEQSKVVLLAQETFEPKCEDPLALLNLIGAPCTGTDHAQVCTPPVKTSQASFLSKVTSQLNDKRNRQGR